MSWLIDRLTEPWQTDLVARAGLELVLIGVVAGALGVFVVVRGLAFTTEAFAHTVFPGAVLAAAFGGSIVVGGLIAALVAAIGMTVAARSDRASDETAVGVVFTGLFGLGALLAAVLGPLDRDVTSFLFGSLLGVSDLDLALTAGTGIAVLAALLVLRRPLVASSFDRDAAAASGVRLGRLDALVLLALALTVVVSVQAVGNVLIVAMLVTPAAAARLITRRIASAIVTAVALGVGSGLGGLYLSFYGSIAAGGSVVLVATGVLLLALIASPRAGPIAALLQARAARPARV